MSLTADQLEERILTLEEKLNEIQTSISNLATRRQLNALYAVKTQNETTVASGITETRVEDIETTLNNLQTAVNNLATQRQLNALVAVIDTQINELESIISGEEDPLIDAHNIDAAAHTNLNDRYYTEGEVDAKFSNLIVDHGTLSGLADDDHTQYLLANGAREVTGNLIVSGQVLSKLQTTYIPTASTQVIDLNNGNIQTVLLTSANNNVAITFSNRQAGSSWLVKVMQHAASGYNVTFSGVKWSGGEPPTLTTTASGIDIFSFLYDGENTYGSVLQDMK